MGPSGQKTGAVRAGVRLRFPIDGADVFIRRATAILSVLRTHAVPILGDFPGDPVRGSKRGDHLAYQLRLANAARVPANNDQAPPVRRFFVISRQAFPLAPRCARPIAEAGHTMRTAL